VVVYTIPFVKAEPVGMSNMQPELVDWFEYKMIAFGLLVNSVLKTLVTLMNPGYDAGSHERRVIV
jgi:hypothetical protein